MKFGACGHPLRYGKLCGVCWLLAFESDEVRDSDEQGHYADRAEARDEWRGREGEANAWDGARDAWSNESIARLEALERQESPGPYITAVQQRPAGITGAVGWSTEEVAETTARICPASSRIINFRFGQTIACPGEAVHATDHGTYILIDEALPSQRIKRHVVGDGITEEMMLGVW